jgi:hypothetical protein
VSSTPRLGADPLAARQDKSLWALTLATPNATDVRALLMRRRALLFAIGATSA